MPDPFPKDESPRAHPNLVGIALKAAAARSPEQRSGQLIVNALHAQPLTASRDLFNIEDHDLALALLRYAAQ